VSTFVELLHENPVLDECCRHVPPQPNRLEPASSLAAIEEEQVRTLVDRLFVRSDVPLQHVAFVAIDADTETAPLCLAVATVLSEDGTHDIGLIDASPHSEPLHLTLGLTAGDSLESPWQVSRHLWLAECPAWADSMDSPAISIASLSRLRDLRAQFDCTVLRCPPASWFTTRLAQACDGIVLVLTANRTRRASAAQVCEQLKRARVPVLGTVLLGRRFPVPQNLYRSL
jgi:hypothetical protein